MITIDRQKNLFLNVGRNLKKKIVCYAIGGTAMMFHGFKDSTLDIDLVFENVDDRKAFSEAIIMLGYQDMNSKQVYGIKKNQPKMYTLGDERFDLFLEDVVSCKFSSDMKKRANEVHQFFDNFVLKIADLHDIILMKSATDRLKDIDDVRNIINEYGANYSVLIDEAKSQVELGNRRALFELGCFLEDLRRMKVKIPKKVLDEIFRSLNRF